MTSDAVRRLGRRVALLAALTLGVLVAGTLGYRRLSAGAASWLDCLYMTVITVTTIGYGEVLDPAVYGPGLRVFNMLIAATGIGIITYTLSSVTSFAVDGELRALWRRRAMQAQLNALTGHYLIAGWGTLAPAVARELRRTGRTVVAIVPSEDTQAAAVREGVELTIVGDATDDERLTETGITRAAGIFAATDDDHLNIIISLSARRLNSSIRVVAAARDEANAAKMRRAGADATVTVSSIAGLRMASEMVRPAVVSFLDTMLRQSDPPLRVEEVAVGSRAEGRRLADVPVSERRDSLVLAVRRGDGWTFNPLPTWPLQRGDVVVLMTTPADLAAWRRELQGD
ncbi:MAG: NAD-binding protein [Kiritimatiellae bacterium]|nr:NAD-binding protein [Kiritimatiellia bacterium]